MTIWNQPINIGDYMPTNWFGKIKEVLGINNKCHLIVPLKRENGFFIAQGIKKGKKMYLLYHFLKR